MLERLGISIVKYKGWSLFLILVITILSMMSISQKASDGLPVDFSPKAIFIDGGEELERLRHLETVFGREDNDLLIIIHGNKILDPEGILYLKELHKVIERDIEKKSISSILTVDYISEEDGMIAIQSLWNNNAKQVLENIKGEPYKDLLLSEDGHTTLIQIRLPKELEKTAVLAPMVHKLEEHIKEVPIPSGIELHITGVPHVRTEVVDMMLSDNLFFAPTLTLLFLGTISFSLWFSQSWFGTIGRCRHCSCLGPWNPSSSGRGIQRAVYFGSSPRSHYWCCRWNTRCLKISRRNL